jgi:hypothetical protein
MKYAPNIVLPLSDWQHLYFEPMKLFSGEYEENWIGFKQVLPT